MITIPSCASGTVDTRGPDSLSSLAAILIATAIAFPKRGVGLSLGILNHFAYLGAVASPT
jgi:hypothetical protein